MPYQRRTISSFGFPTSSRRDSFSLPDYYRSTRVEQYGPFYRSSESVRDLMKTIDLRGRESPDSICALPDIPEEEELQLDPMTFEVVAKVEHEKPAHNDTQHPNEHEKKEKQLGWLWRLSLSALKKCRPHRAEAVKRAGHNVRFDLSA